MCFVDVCVHVYISSGKMLIYRVCTHLNWYECGRSFTLMVIIFFISISSVRDFWLFHICTDTWHSHSFLVVCNFVNFIPFIPFSLCFWFIWHPMMNNDDEWLIERYWSNWMWIANTILQSGDCVLTFLIISLDEQVFNFDSVQVITILWLFLLSCT